jgi:hypothetical protein
VTTASRPIPASAVAFDGELSPTLRPPELTDRGDRGELGPVAPNLGLSFSRDIVALAERALSEGHVPRSDHHSKFDDRTRARAALLYLKTQYPSAAWPSTLSIQYQRLFGERWTTTENERGLKSLMRLLGLSYRDPAARARVVGMV